MGATSKYWYDGRPRSGGFSDAGAAKYWYDGLPVGDLTVSALAITGSAGIASGEAFGATGQIGIQAIAGTAGIASDQAFGTTGAISALIDGATGIATAEAFGAGGVLAGPISGSAGIVSAEAFGSSGAIVGAGIVGTTGIVSAGAFGSGGALSGPITGITGIVSATAFGSGGFLTGPLSGITGIISAEAFGAGGILAGPISGVTGIVSAGAMGTGGVLGQRIIGSTGIVSAGAFGATGKLASSIRGYTGIVSAGALGRGGAVLGTAAWTVYISGVNRSAYLKAGTMNITCNLKARSSATFQLFDPLSRYRPNPGDEVVFYRLSSRIFGGFVDETEEECYQGSSGMMVNVRCVDYAEILERRVVARTYPGPTHSLKARVRDIVATFLDDEGLTYTATEEGTLTNTGNLVLDEVTVADAFNTIGSAFGFDWRVDFLRNIHFERNYGRVAPHVIADNDGRWREMKVKRSKRAYRNRQGIRTIGPTSGQRTTTLFGRQSYVIYEDIYTYPTTYVITDKPTVRVNGVQKIVVLGPGYQAGPWDFYYVIGEKKIEQNRSQPNYLDVDVITITHRSDSLDVVWVEDTAEILRRQAREGGSGVHEVVRQERNIRDLGAAQEMARGLLERDSNIPYTINFETDTDGWEVGQLVTIFTSTPRLAGAFLITGVSIHEMGKALLRHNITCNGVEPPLILGLRNTTPTEVEVIVDRNVDLSPGDDVWITGLNPPWDVLDGEYTAGGGTAGDRIIVSHPAPPDTGGGLAGSFSGGLGGAGGGVGAGGGGGLGGGYGYGGGEALGGGAGFPTGGLPYGGGLFTGSSPTPASGSGSGVGTPAVIPIAVTPDGARRPEFTTDRAHGLSNSSSVAIVGVTGDGFNTGNSRVLVTGTTTFKALDNYVPISGGDPFQDDRRGRVYLTGTIPRPALAPATNLFPYLLSSAAEPANTATERATFVLANAIPGFASRPLQAGSNVTNAWIAQTTKVVESVSAFFNSPPLGQDIILDIRRNGVSIFASGAELRFPDGSTTVARVSNFASTPLTISPDDRVTIDVKQVGSTFAGCNGTCVMTLR